LGHNKDQFLLDLVTVVEAGGVSPRVTLLIGGAAYTGHLISRQDYYTAMRKRIGVLPDDSKATLDGILTRMEAAKPDPDEADELDTSPGLLYLAGVKSPEGRHTVYWRVKIESVEAFTFPDVPMPNE